MNTQAELEMVGRVALAMVLGALVGLEREFRGHEAGIRTSSLVCLGAAIFGEISFTMGDDRIAAGVVQGVGFLGAGLIYVRKGAPAGVTTAACTWVLAGVGLLVSTHFELAGILLTVLIILLLELAPVSDWVYLQGREYRKRRGQREPDSPYDDDYETESDDDTPSDDHEEEVSSKTRPSRA